MPESISAGTMMQVLLSAAKQSWTHSLSHLHYRAYHLLFTADKDFFVFGDPSKKVISLSNSFLLLFLIIEGKSDIWCTGLSRLLQFDKTIQCLTWKGSIWSLNKNTVGMFTSQIRVLQTTGFLLQYIEKTGFFRMSSLVGRHEHSTGN